MPMVHIPQQKKCCLLTR